MCPVRSSDRLALPHRRFSRVTWLCWFGLLAEGYDIGVLGAIMPGLLADPVWHLSAFTAGLLASAALVGMFFGGFGMGAISDIHGPKRCFLFCLALFLLTLVGAALAPSPVVFALLRAVGGIGAGGIIPVASALTTEFAPPDRKNREFGLMYTGYSFGILVSSLVSFLLLREQGWRVVMAVGAAPLMLLPLIALWLPESPAALAARGRVDEAERIRRRYRLDPARLETRPPARGMLRHFGVLLAPAYRRASIGFWLTMLFGMQMVYGLATWLPQIMRVHGYRLGSSILFLGVFALASAIGGVLLGFFADRLGRRPVVTAAFVLGAISILCLAYPMPLAVTDLLVALAGTGTVGAAVVVTGYESAFYPAHLRATAVGTATSVSRVGAVLGPVLGGSIAMLKLGFVWNFIVFACVGILAALSIRLVPGEVSSDRSGQDERCPAAICGNARIASPERRPIGER